MFKPIHGDHAIDELCNEIRDEYARVVAVDEESEDTNEHKQAGLNYMLQMISKLPSNVAKGRAYVCEDGEMGVVWEDEDQRVEIGIMPSTSVVEYLVWDIRRDVSTEKEWDVKGGEEIPDIVKKALEKMSGR